MKKILYFIVVFSVIVSISGCVTIEKKTRERVDQDLAGNRGVIQGQRAMEPSKARSAEREYVDIRVEIPTMEEIRKRFFEIETPEDVSAAGEDLPASERIEEPVSVRRTRPTLYKVKEGDSLGLIAMKFYGKASKWTLIYEANMDKIDDPQRLKPGIELVIPPLEKESDYIK